MRLAGCGIFACVAGSAPAGDGAAFFEAKIRPLLVERCIECHGEKKQKGGLRLDSRAGWQVGGDNGPALVPGRAEESLLIKAVRHTDEDLAMPPKKKGGKLGDAQISALVQWVNMGAPDPREQIATGPRLRSGKFVITEADRAYWAFQPVKRPGLPAAKAPDAIDSFILAKLGEKALTMNPPATPREQVRRAFFDLWGLPPDPGDVAAFEREPTDAAWTRIIDRLLASPHYGERWGRHWLDLVRFAESNGYERDAAKPDAWRYRDYVIASFNADKPYDRFIREQIAGDELAEEIAPGPEWRDAIIATGFFRFHVWDDEPDSTVVAEFDDLDDIMVTTGTAFLGLTVGCARCHDHKFDPISQADYYSLLSFFRSIDPYGQHKTGGGGRGRGQITRLLAAPAELQQWEAGKQQRIKEIEQRLAAAADAEAKKQAEGELKQVRKSAPPFGSALAVVENGPAPKKTHVLSRGEAGTPREEVSPSFPAVLGPAAPVLPQRPRAAQTTGRRRVLADWVASPENPLTARVMVNRIWQHHFGVGIVPTPDDFGRTGLAPTNQPLLDHLAAEFIAGGWSIKNMHRRIMTSRAYRMSSRAENRPALAVDEGNVLLWRQNLRRVEAEVIRDMMLAVSGEMNPKQGGPGVFPTLPKAVHSTQDSSGKGWTDSPPKEQNRRSVYLFVKRALKVPLLEALDFANSASPSGTRPITTTAPQALMLLNDSFVHAQAAALAERLIREAGEKPDAQAARAFQLVLQREPKDGERSAALALLADQRQRAIAEGAAKPEHTALRSFARALLNANETIYVE